MTNLKVRVTVFIGALTVAIIWLLSPDHEGENRIKYLNSLNLNITGIIKQVMPLRDNDHSYGTIYLQNITSNKRGEFESAYKGRYTVCKIGNNEAIIVTPSIELMNPGDSVIYNTHTLKFKIYKKGKLYVEDGFGLNADDGFYNVLNINRYLDFGYYQRK